MDCVRCVSNASSVSDRRGFSNKLQGLAQFLRTLYGRHPAGRFAAPASRLSHPRLPIILSAGTSVAGQQNANYGTQSQSNTEQRAERAERMLFDLMFGVVDQIFGGAAALFERAFRRVDAIFDCISDSNFSRAQLPLQAGAAAAPTSVTLSSSGSFIVGPPF